MGACESTEAGGAAGQPSMEEVSRSKGIDRMLRDEEERMAREAKVRPESTCLDTLDPS